MEADHFKIHAKASSNVICLLSSIQGTSLAGWAGSLVGQAGQAGNVTIATHSPAGSGRPVRPAGPAGPVRSVRPKKFSGYNICVCCEILAWV